TVSEPKVILKADWSQIFRGETVTLSCQIQGGGGTQWTYEWRQNWSNIPPTSSEYRIDKVKDDHSGDYSCQGRSGFLLTQWSDAFRLSVSRKPQPVLSVSPSWLSPGASVTLSCEVKPPSAGWRFFWYKAKKYGSYSYELLPGSSNGTQQNSYIIHGQKHTAGYVCRAGRGESAFYSDYSEPSFVWSAAFPPAASLRVNPDRVQLFRSESVSLSCEGNSTEWRVKRFPETGHLSDFNCSTWGTMTGSSCIIKPFWSDGGVFWCESGSGEFSNAVNITVQDKDDGIILQSPVHPVTEGDPVTLSCRTKQQKLLSDVSFYHNNKLLQNDGREELKISAVSKSDEGFYSCEHSGQKSPQSWMSVQGEEASNI
uniref:B-cell receptor CD22-like n=2 Tax=Kryptolebias marmoratus TaxID=37003 RepID=A0A3Q3B270_KRYMA